MNPDELKAWRESADMTQCELAGHLGVASLTVSRWERGTREIPSFLPLALETIERRGNKSRRRTSTTEARRASGNTL
jgi:transcriptional regulator with XRE-family HTH domain